MTVDAIMSCEVVTVAPDESLMTIRRLLNERGFHHLLVVDDDQLQGVISDRDMLRTVSPFLDTLSESHRDVRTLSRTADEIMHPPSVTARPDMPVEEAATMLLENKISCLPVLGDDGQLEGILTSKDVLRCFIEH